MFGTSLFTVCITSIKNLLLALFRYLRMILCTAFPKICGGIDIVLGYLQQQKKLTEKYKDHLLTGNYTGLRECHINLDWLLIYKIDQEKLILALARTGSHSELF